MVEAHRLWDNDARNYNNIAAHRRIARYRVLCSSRAIIRREVQQKDGHLGNGLSPV